MSQPINFQAKLNLISEHWSPKVIAEMNDYQFKLVKIKGEFVIHNHQDTDEVFIIIEGEMKIEFEDQRALRNGLFNRASARSRSECLL